MNATALCSEPRRAPDAFLVGNSRRGKKFPDACMLQVEGHVSRGGRLGWDGASLESVSAFCIDPLNNTDPTGLCGGGLNWNNSYSFTSGVTSLTGGSHNGFSSLPSYGGSSSHSGITTTASSYVNNAISVSAAYTAAQNNDYVGTYLSSTLSSGPYYTTTSGAFYTHGESFGNQQASSSSSNTMAFVGGAVKGAVGVAMGAGVVLAAATISPAVAAGVAIGGAAYGGYSLGQSIYQAATGNEVAITGSPTGRTLTGPQRADLAGQAVVGLSALGMGVSDVIAGRMSGPGLSTAGGADSAPAIPTSGTRIEYRYGPVNDPKINANGSTNPKLWTTPDNYNTWGQAASKMDAFGWPIGVRTVTIPAGHPASTGTTPGGQSNWANGLGGANETKIPMALPPGSVGPWHPIVPYTPPTVPGSSQKPKDAR